MIDDSLRTQAALYALDALPADEAAAFREQAAGNAELAETVAEYEAAAAIIAESVGEIPPPSDLRARILASVAEKPAPIRAHRRTVWLPWALAAGFAFATGAFWVEIQRLIAENAGHRAAWIDLNRRLEGAGQARVAQEELAAALRKRIAELEKRSAIAETQIATLTSKLDASYLASIAWDNQSQEGILHVRRLPVAGEGKAYQLWVVDPKYSAPISAGVFTVQPDGSANIHFTPTQRISAASAFAITLERAGGVPKAEGPVVLSD